MSTVTDSAPHGMPWTHADEVAREPIAFVGHQRLAPAPA
jgi:hypothetical protein